MNKHLISIVILTLFALSSHHTSYAMTSHKELKQTQRTALNWANIQNKLSKKTKPMPTLTLSMNPHTKLLALGCITLLLAQPVQADYCSGIQCTTGQRLQGTVLELRDKYHKITAKQQEINKSRFQFQVHMEQEIAKAASKVALIKCSHDEDCQQKKLKQEQSKKILKAIS